MQLRHFVILLTVLVAGNLTAAAGNLLANPDFSNNLENWKIMRHGARTETESPVSAGAGRLSVSAPERLISTAHWHLQAAQELALPKDGKFVLDFTLEAAEPGEIFVSFRTARPPRQSLGAGKVFKTAAGRNRLQFVFTPLAPPPGEPTELSFQLGMVPGDFSLSGLRLTQIDPSGMPFRLGEEWKIFTDVKPPAEYREIPQKLQDSAGKTIRIPYAPGKANLIDLKKIHGSHRLRAAAILYNSFESPGEGYIQAGVSADWWMELYCNGEKVCDTMSTGNGGSFSPDSHEILLPVKKGRNLLAVKVLAGSEGWKFVWGTPQPPIVFREGEGWKKLDLSSVVIREGSALDLSSLTREQAGQSGRLIAAPGGVLVQEKNGEPIRLQGFSSGIPDDIWTGGSDEEFKAKAREFARAARRQGYNLFRTHGLDRWLCHDSLEDMAVSPKYLDRWDYLFSEMKREGIYIQLVIFSFGLYSKADGYRPTYNDRDLHKLMLYLGGEWERERFRYGVETLLNHVNPYTGIAWKDDPAFAIVEFYNEQYSGVARLEKIARENPAGYARFLTIWRDWLKKQGRDNADAAPAPALGVKSDPLSNDLGIFFLEKTIETSRWCEKVIRETGYTGLVTQNSYHSLYCAAAAWETLPVVDKHSYYMHPSNWAQPGSRVGKASSVGQQASNFRALAAGKIAGRPMFVGEFNHCFWNPHQYEAGLVLGGYAAFQNFSALAIHSHPVLLQAGNSAASCFFSGNSAVSRAGEFLSSALFRRGDLTPSPHLVALTIPNRWLKSNASLGQAVSNEQNKLSLLTGFALAFPELPVPAGIPAPPPPDMAILPAGGAAIEAHDWYTRVMEGSDQSFSIDKAAAELKKRNILPAGNRTDPARGIYESDTGEILMRSREKLLRVVTPRTEAVTLTAGKGEALKQLTVEKTSVDACIGAVSADGLPLAESRRLVIVCSTEMANSGMQLAADREGLKTLGGPPVLMRTGKFTLKLANRHAGKLKLYALALDGSRTGELPVKAQDGILSFEIDTAKLKQGPTPFFELAQ